MHSKLVRDEQDLEQDRSRIFKITKISQDYSVWGDCNVLSAEGSLEDKRP